MSAKKIVLVTGANTGIGFEVVRALLKTSHPYHILFGSRSPEKGGSAIKRLQEEFPSTVSSIELLQVDISQDESIAKAFEKVKSKFDHLDALVNNAGGRFDDQGLGGHEMNLREAFNATYDLNVTSSHIMTNTFAPLLTAAPEPRLLFVTSGLSTLEGCSHGLFPPGHLAGRSRDYSVGASIYRASKTGLNMLMLIWHWMLKEDGVKTWCISPGWLATGLENGDPETMRKRGAGDPALGGEFIARVIEGDRDADVGKVITSAGIQPW